MRQTAGHGSNDGDAMTGKVPDPAGRYGGNYRDQRPGKLGEPAV